MEAPTSNRERQNKKFSASFSTPLSEQIELLVDPRNTTHVRPQYVRNCNGSIGVLIVFHDRDQHAWTGDGGVVERVAEHRLLGILRPITEIQSPRLEVA